MATKEIEIPRSKRFTFTPLRWHSSSPRSDSPSSIPNVLELPPKLAGKNPRNYSPPGRRPLPGTGRLCSITPQRKFHGHLRISRWPRSCAASKPACTANTRARHQRNFTGGAGGGGRCRLTRCDDPHRHSPSSSNCSSPAVFRRRLCVSPRDSRKMKSKWSFVSAAARECARTAC